MPQYFHSVFADEVLKKLPLDGNIYTKADIEAEPEKFKAIEYIFATWGMPEFTDEEVKAYFPSLKAIFYAAGSVQKFAAPFLSNGVRLFSAWRANAIPVAEFTLAQILLANKGYFLSTPAYSVGDRQTSGRIKNNYPGNFGATVGIIGVGMIGRKVIELLKPFKLKVLAFDAFMSEEEIAALGAEKVSLQELFERCNIVSNHLADNIHTKGMLDYELFSKMMPYSTFINTGRGAQVAEDDLVRVLTEREDICALLDVTYPEPPAEGHAFFSLKNCFISHHIAGSSGQEVARMGEYMLEAYNDYLCGNKNENEVTLEMLKTMA